MAAALAAARTGRGPRPRPPGRTPRPAPARSSQRLAQHAIPATPPCREFFSGGSSQAVSLALHPATREPLVAVWGFAVNPATGVEEGTGVREVQLYRGGAWQAVGSPAQLPALGYT